MTSAPLAPRVATRPSMGRARLRAEIFFWRHGWLWAVVLLLSVTGACVWLGGRWVIARDDAQMREDILALRVSRDEAERLSRSGARDSGEMTASLESDADRSLALAAVLSPREQADEQIRQIYRLAADLQVKIEEATFHSDGEGRDIQRLKIDIPTKANYPGLRRFVEAVLVALPNASLDRLSFHRDQVAQAQVEARIYLSLWLKPAAEAVRSGASAPSTKDVAR